VWGDSAHVQHSCKRHNIIDTSGPVSEELDGPGGEAIQYGFEVEICPLPIKIQCHVHARLAVCLPYTGGMWNLHCDLRFVTKLRKNTTYTFRRKGNEGGGAPFCLVASNPLVLPGFARFAGTVSSAALTSSPLSLPSRREPQGA